MGTHANRETTTAALLADPAARAVLDAIRRIVRALRESSREAEGKLGLSGAQLFVLQRLASAPALSLNDLADRTLTHQSTVSVVVTRLVARGLVSRSRGGSDGRRVEIALTARGRASLKQAPAAAQDRLITALGAVGPTGRRTLARELGRLIEAMALPVQAPPMFFEPADKAAKRAQASRAKASRVKASRAKASQAKASQAKAGRVSNATKVRRGK